jgi:F-type H+-transporting ATPase subunit epsilon
MPIHCEIVSQDRVVYQGDPDMVILPGAAGDMGILPNHAAVLSVLRYGLIRVRTKGEEHYFTVSGGIVEVQPDQITVLADAAENVKEIDIQRAEAARHRAEELLKEGIVKDTDTYLQIQAALKRSNLRLDAVRRYQHKGRS